MNKREPITAKELMEQLEADSEFVAARAIREKELADKKATLRADQQLLVRELRLLGFDVDSVWDFVNAGNPHDFLRSRVSTQYERAYPVLVRHLGVAHHARIREGIIRALTVHQAPAEVWQALLSEFEAEEDPMLKWVLANALRTAMPARERRKHRAVIEVFRRGGAA